jgi:hypothetical protein
MTLSSLNATMSAVLAAGALVALIAGWLRWVRPRYRKARATMTAATDAIVGRPALLDSITGEEKVPALPGIGVRMAHQERQMELLAVTVTKLVDQQTHQRALEQRVDTHDDRIRALEDAAVERVVGKAESAQAWSAMEAAIKARPSDDDAPPAVE